MVAEVLAKKKLENILIVLELYFLAGLGFNKGKTF